MIISFSRILHRLKSALAAPNPLSIDTPPSRLGRPRKPDFDAWSAHDRSYSAHRYRTMDIRLLWATSRLSRLKCKARKLKVRFDLTVQDLSDLLDASEMRCAVLGTKLEFARGKGSGSNSVSLLRLDPQGAFTKANMVVCSTSAIRLFNFIDLPQAVELGRFAAAVLLTMRQRVNTSSSQEQK